MPAHTRGGGGGIARPHPRRRPPARRPSGLAYGPRHCGIGGPRRDPPCAYPGAASARASGGAPGAGGGGSWAAMIRPLLNSMLYFPNRKIIETPAQARLEYRELGLSTDDGERLHGWWIDSRAGALGHLLLCHGNAGNIGDRVLHAALLTDVGFDVVLFDYRGYGRSTGRPSEEGTYRDARAAGAALVRQEEVDESRVIYLGESLGAAVALALALEAPPRGLILQSAFTSVRDMGREHYHLPRALVPDAYPSLSRIQKL